MSEHSNVHGPFETPVDPDRAAAFADALDDRNPAYASMAPPTFVAALTREAMVRVLTTTVPPEGLRGGVHGEQDMRFHRPLVPGTTVSSTIDVRSLRVGPSGSRLTLLIASRDAEGVPVAEQLWTTFFRGADLGDAYGPDLPDHTLPEGAATLARITIPLAPDQPIRYGRASGEDSAIHVDEEAARRAGFDGIIAHGMCTLGMCAAAIVARFAGGDPSRLARLAVRFAGVAYPGADLELSVFDAGGAYAFEATAGGRPHLAHGRAEIRP
jgi:acyl dehydratase